MWIVLTALSDFSIRSHVDGEQRCRMREKRSLTVCRLQRAVNYLKRTAAAYVNLTEMRNEFNYYYYYYTPAQPSLIAF